MSKLPALLLRSSSASLKPSTMSSVWLFDKPVRGSELTILIVPLSPPEVPAVLVGCSIAPVVAVGSAAGPPQAESNMLNETAIVSPSPSFLFLIVRSFPPFESFCGLIPLALRVDSQWRCFVQDGRPSRHTPPAGGERYRT